MFKFLIIKKEKGVAPWFLPVVPIGTQMIYILKEENFAIREIAKNMELTFPSGENKLSLIAKKYLLPKMIYKYD